MCIVLYIVRCGFSLQNYLPSHLSQSFLIFPQNSGSAIVISADAKHRFGVDIFYDECCRAGLDIKVSDVSTLYDGTLLSGSNGGIKHTSGYVENMDLTLFSISKPTRI